MKKIFLLLFAAVCTVASWAADATVSATFSGNKLVVSLDNETQPFVAFQMDITLPAGVTVESEGAIVMNKERLTEQAGTPVAGATDANFIIAYNKIDETHVRVLAYNLENRAIAGETGELFTMNYSGDATGFTIDNIRFVTETELAETALAMVEAAEAAGTVPGDVDGSGACDIRDVSAALNMFLGKQPVNSVADVNGDGVVSINEVSAILNIFLGK